MMRVDCVYFATEIKRTERNKLFVMTESTKVTKKPKARKHDYPLACAEIFPEGGQRRHFVHHFQIADDQCSL